jgi:hypothetical protein
MELTCRSKTITEKLVTLDVAKTEDVSSELTSYASTCTSAIQDKLELLIQENKQLKSEIVAIRETGTSTTSDLREQHKMEIAALQESIKSERAAIFEQHKVGIAAIHDRLDTVIERLSLPRTDDDQPSKKRRRRVVNSSQYLTKNGEWFNAF